MGRSQRTRTARRSRHVETLVERQRGGTVPRHLYFLGKDNIPFHTVIWPALLLGLNHVNKGMTADEPVSLPGYGEFALETNVPAMEYLMLAGGQFSNQENTPLASCYWSATPLTHFAIT